MWHVSNLLGEGAGCILIMHALVSALQVQQYLDQFISTMKSMFEKHKKTAGYPDCQLVVL